MNDEIEVRQLTEQPTVSIREQVARDMIRPMLAERVTEIEAFIASRRGRARRPVRPPSQLWRGCGATTSIWKWACLRRKQDAPADTV